MRIRDNLDDPPKMVEIGRNIWSEPENILTESQQKELAERSRDGNRCLVSIWHGPGHQSRSECQNLEPNHDRHFVNYGSFGGYAEWQGIRDVFSDYWDDFDENNPSYVRDDWTLRHRRRYFDRIANAD